MKQIYDAYLSGKSLQDIKFVLESGGIPTKTGLSTWSIQAILNILQNEKYTGNALLQKTYTTDPISKSRKKNQGELPQYLIKIVILQLSHGRRLIWYRRRSFGDPQ